MSTRIVLQSDKAASGYVLLAILPGTVRTKLGADLYVGQTRYEVEHIAPYSDDDENRTIVVRAPTEDRAP